MLRCDVGPKRFLAMRRCLLLACIVLAAGVSLGMLRDNFVAEVIIASACVENGVSIQCCGGRNRRRLACFPRSRDPKLTTGWQGCGGRVAPMHGLIKGASAAATLVGAAVVGCCGWLGFWIGMIWFLAGVVCAGLMVVIWRGVALTRGQAVTATSVDCWLCCWGRGLSLLVRGGWCGLACHGRLFPLSSKGVSGKRRVCVREGLKACHAC